MERANTRSTWAKLSLPVLVLAPAIATAQELKTEPEPGELIISRDVANRGVGSPNVPGAISTVDANPDELIESTLASGLQPITDAEAGEISSGPQAAGGLVNETLATGLNPLGDTQTTSSFSPTESGGGVVSSTINEALGAIPSAMGALQGALGGDQ